MTYRVGFTWITSVYFMLAIIVFYLVYALRLRTLSRRHGFITPVDYLSYRFGVRRAQSPGRDRHDRLTEQFSPGAVNGHGACNAGDGGGGFRPGLYQRGDRTGTYHGGLRPLSAACAPWHGRDAVQGTVLFIGFILLIASLVVQFGPLSVATTGILESPASAKVMLPDADRMRQWLSYILLVGMGGALYPQAIQRIYASRSVRALRQSLAGMAVLQVFATLIAVIAGIYAIANIPGLEGVQADQALMRIFRLIQEDSVFGYWLVVILFAAIISAMMSTADSALLTISSMVTKDVYGGYFRGNASQAELDQGRKTLFLGPDRVSRLAGNHA